MRRTNSLAIHVTTEALLAVILHCLDGFHVQLACKLQGAVWALMLQIPIYALLLMAALHQFGI